jgi:hypothetical protein
LLYLITRERKPATSNASIGKIIAIEIEEPSARNPIIEGPIKNPDRPITNARALETDGAIPGMELAAKINAGNIGAIPNPASAKPKLIMTSANNGCVSERGTAIAILEAQPIPPINPAINTSFLAPK